MNIKPCKPVAPVLMPIYGCAYIAFVKLILYVADFLSASHSSFEQRKETSFWIVGKKFAQTFCGKIMLAHAVRSVKAMVWEVMPGACQPLGIAHYRAK